MKYAFISISVFQRRWVTPNPLPGKACLRAAPARLSSRPKAK
jgi:hypothetical protein